MSFPLNWRWLLYGVGWGHASSIIPDSRVVNNTVENNPSQSESLERLFICHRAQYGNNFSTSEHSFRFMKSNNFFSGFLPFPKITIQMRNHHAFNNREFSPRPYSCQRICGETDLKVETFMNRKKKALQYLNLFYQVLECTHLNQALP